MHRVSMYTSFAIECRPALERKYNQSTLQRNSHLVDRINRDTYPTPTYKWDMLTNRGSLIHSRINATIAFGMYGNLDVVSKGMCSREEWECELDFAEC